MKSIKTWIGPVVIGLLLINLLGHYGSQWDPGKFGMPSAMLIEASGKAYQDGAPADEIAVALAKSHHEHEAWLSLVALLIALLIWGGMTVRRVYLDRKKIAATHREIPAPLQMAAATAGAEAEPVTPAPKGQATVRFKVSLPHNMGGMVVKARSTTNGRTGIGVFWLVMAFILSILVPGRRSEL